MHPKTMMVLAGLIFATCLGMTGVLADPPEPHGSTTEGGGLHWPRLWLRPVPSDTGHYIGYYVGGGNGRPHKAEARREDEGTWGWDYQGWLIPRRVFLGWWHGQKYQGGTGSYRTDGPHLYREKEEGK
jgi:hypothetical protein